MHQCTSSEFRKINGLYDLHVDSSLPNIAKLFSRDVSPSSSPSASSGGRERNVVARNDIKTMDDFFHDWDTLEVIGRGGQGTIHSIRRVNERSIDIAGIQYAAKVMQCGDMSCARKLRKSSVYRKLKRYEAAKQFNLGHVVDCYYDASDYRLVVLVMERLCHSLSDKSWWRKSRNSTKWLTKGYISWRNDFFIMHLALDVARNLKSIHDAGYVHCDVKPGNIMWHAEELMWVLIDYDVLKKATDADLKEFCGTPGWTAPEVKRTDDNNDTSYRVSGKSDIYCLALVLLHTALGAERADVYYEIEKQCMQLEDEVLHGDVVAGVNGSEETHRVMQSFVKHMSEDGRICEELSILLVDMLQFEAAKRPDIDTLIITINVLLEVM